LGGERRKKGGMRGGEEEGIKEGKSGRGGSWGIRALKLVC